MSRRADREDSDSCELMLDTICNVFGGMILMAVLVVIQTQASVARIPQIEEQARERALAARKVEFQIRRLQDEMEDLQRRRKGLNEQYAATVSSDTDKLLKERRAFRDRLKQAEDMLKELRKDKADADRQLMEARKYHGDIEKDNEAKRAELASLEGQLEREQRLARRRKIPTEKVRLPIAHESRSPNQRIYVVEGGRVYLFPGQCNVQRLGDDRKRVSPKSGDGFVLGPQGDNASFCRTLESIRRTTHYVTLFVAGSSTSFKSFQVARRLIAEKGFDCGYTEYDLQKGLIMVTGRPPVQ